jgi:ParB family chromosome partitioning protein
MDDSIEKLKLEKDIFSKAKLVRFLLKEKDIKVMDLAAKLSLTSSYICHLNRLNEIPEIIIDGYYSNLVNISHLFILSRIKDKKKMLEIYEKILSDNLTIRQTDDLISELIHQVKASGKYLIPEEKFKLKEDLEKRFPNMKTSITQTRSRTKINLELKGSLEETSAKTKKIFNELLGAEDL